MTVSVQTTYNLAAGNGVTTVFPYQFKILANTDLQVYVAGVLKALGIDYTVSGVGVDVGGSVTFISGAPAALASVSILRAMAVRRTTDYQQLGDFLTPVVNPDLDNAILLIQDVQTQLGRSIRTPPDEVGSLPTLPSIAQRAGKFSAFDALGLPIASSGTGNDSALRVDLATSTLGAEGSKLVGTRRTTAGATKRVYDLLYRDLEADDFGVNTTPGTTNMGQALAAALAAITNSACTIKLRQENAIAAPLVLTSAIPNPRFSGDGRVISLLSPTAIDISQAPKSINCLIYNADNNGHLQMENLRFYSIVAYTGVGIYCVEGGGGDGSGQCLFSATFNNIWVSFSSTNSGWLTGTTQNSFFDGFTCETMKGMFTFVGIANADNHYKNFSLFNCYDALFLQVADTNGSLILTVDGVHAYSHNRGYLIDVKNWNGANIKNVILEPAAGNLGNVGIGKFTDGTNLIIEGLILRTRAGVPAGETVLEFAGAVTSSAKVSKSTLMGNRGCKISATGTIDLEFDGVDFSTAGVNCFDTTGAVTGGRLITRNCKFNSAQIHNFVHTAGVGYSWYSYGDEFLDAGLGGNGASRCLAISSSGEIILTSPKIGRTTGGAAANFFIEASGAGTVKIIHPTFVGTPPTGIKTGAQEVQIIYKPGFGSDIASAAAIVIPNEGDIFNVTGVTNITSISAGNMKGRRVTLVFAGILTFTDGSNLLLAGNFVTTADDTITLGCNGANWYEISRSVN